jgi:DNA-binding transcriptional MerR regulator
MPEHPYLSIGEVLALLLEEFPDVTISKIRFLESQGLIDPERTPSGYRKFYDLDVDRLRVILREQRENFLPLRVIRDRLESGEIDETGALTPPRGLRNVTVLEREPALDPGFDETGELDIPEGTVVATGHHPAAQLRMASSSETVSVQPAAPVASPSATSAAAPSSLPTVSTSVSLAAVPNPTATPPSAPSAHAPAAALPPSAPARPPVEHLTSSNPAAAFFAGNGEKQAPLAPVETVHDTYVASELCTMAGITSKQLVELESYGLLAGRGTGTSALYSSSDLAIARAASGFLARGVEPRHLRGWRQSAEREASLFEQLVLPLIRQRNPQSRQQAAALLTELARQGGELRAAILHSALQHHLEP